MKIKNCLRIFVMILLVAILSSMVLGANEFSINVSGDAGVSGFRSRTDSIVIDVVGFISSGAGFDVINVSQFGAEFSGGSFDGVAIPEFDACVDIGNGFYNCGYESGFSPMLGGSVTVTVHMYDDARNEVSSSPKQATLTVDDVAPIVNILTVQQSSSGTTLTYQVSDSSPSSGLESLEIKEDGVLIKAVALDGLSKSAGDTIKISSNSRTTDNRTYTINAFDRMQNQGTRSETFLIDYFRPRIVSNSMFIMRKGKVVTSLQKGVIIPVDLNVTVIEDSELYGVKADLSALGASNDSSGICNLLTEDPQKMYGCIWPKINAKIVDETQQNVLIKFNLLDVNGNENTDGASRPLKVESTAPQLLKFRMDVNGQEVHDLPKNNARVNFVAQLKEESPGLTSGGVKLDLTNIGGGQSEPADSCILNSSTAVYTCEWSVAITTPKKATSVRLIAEDLIGNSNNGRNVVYNFNVDDTVPVIEFVGTRGVAIDGMNTSYDSFASSGLNEFIAIINEKDSGITKESVELSVANANVLTPNDCTKRNSQEWICVWDAVNIAGGHGADLEISLSIKDNAENRATKKSKVFLDNLRPIIKDISVLSVAREGQVEFHKTTDVLLITATISDHSPVTMKVGLEELGIRENVSVACTPADGAHLDGVHEWICEARTQQGIGIFGPVREDVLFSVQDSVGLEKDIKDEINCNGQGCVELKQSSVIGALVSEDGNKFNFLKVDVADVDTKISSPDFWDVSMGSPSPKTLDRETFEILNSRQYFKFNLLPRAGNKVSILDLTLLKDTCTAKDDVGFASFDIVSEFSLQNNKGANKKNPYLFVEYNRVKATFNEFEFTCTISILSQMERGNKKTLVPVPEFENVTFRTEFFANPIGMISDELAADISKIEKEVFDDLGNTIDEMEEIIAIAKGLCTLFNTWFSIVETWNKIIQLDDAWRHIFKPVTDPAAAGHCFASIGASKVAKDGWAAFGNTFCEYVSCKKTLPGLSDAFGAVFGSGGKMGQFTSVVSGKALADSIGARPDSSKSIVVATMQGCIPGIVAGLQRHREIKCMEGYCLINQVAEGVPRALCEAQKGAMQCKYNVGEMMHILPWNWVMDHYSNMIKGIFQNPLAFVGAAVGWACPASCGYSSLGAGLCSLGDLVKTSSKVASDLDGMAVFKGGDAITGLFEKDNFCNKFQEELDKQ
jgi:hypothetical protein